MAVPPDTVRVPSQRPLAPRVASVTSVVNDKGDNEMILAEHISPGICLTAEGEHISPGICLTAEENPRKPQLGNRLLKGLCDQSLLQMGSLSSKLGR